MIEPSVRPDHDAAGWLGLVIALGIGLLIGAERERRKGEGPSRAAAGIRTFTLAALLGAAGALLGAWVLASALLAVAALVAVAYARRRDEDPGLTTETALLLTAVLGALAVDQPALAAALAVMVAVLLAARAPMHRFVRDALGPAELNDLLTLAAATLVVLPLVPDRYVGPFAAVNPRTIWIIAILVMSIGAASHVALRMFGARLGLPAVGLLSGFVSSAATIGAMGACARRTPALSRPAVAGAMLSTVATFVQMAVVLGAVDPPTLLALGGALVGGGITAAAYGALFTWRSLRERDGGPVDAGTTFSVKAALVLAALIAAVLIVAAALKTWFGQAGLVAAAGIAGFADTHAAAVSVASLAAAGRLDADAAAAPILVALSTNTASKLAMAVTGGGTRFAAQVAPGLMLVAAAAWGGWWLW